MDRNKREEFDNCLILGMHLITASLINKFCVHLTSVTKTSPNHYTAASYGSMTPEVAAPFVNHDDSIMTGCRQISLN